MCSENFGGFRGYGTTDRFMHIFFSVGEPSGDQHAAHLIQDLRRRAPGVRVSGFGGPQMEAAGCSLLFPLTTLAVMGVFRVIPMIGKFYGLYRQAREYLQRHKPDLVVLVDFPGFNWWIASAAKQAGIPVVYYLPPQLWAWAPWRIWRVRKYVDLVLSGLTFETDWYAERKIPVLYVGHPFFDEIAEHRLDEAFCREWTSAKSPTVALLPGSRTHEVSGNWPVIVEVVRRLHQRHPDVNFLVANYREKQRIECQNYLQKHAPELPITSFVGKTSEIIELADCTDGFRLGEPGDAGPSDSLGGALSVQLAHVHPRPAAGDLPVYVAAESDRPPADHARVCLRGRSGTGGPAARGGSGDVAQPARGAGPRPDRAGRAA